MKRSLGCLGLCIVAALCASPARASQIIACPALDQLYFYLVDGWPNGNLAIEDEYRGVTPDGRGRTIQVAHVDGGNLFGVCSSAKAAFESAMHVKKGNPIAGEL